MATASAKIRREEVEEFRELCNTAGMSVHAALAKYIRRCNAQARLTQQQTPPRRRGWF